MATAMTPDLVFLKLGGSVITDKRQAFAARTDVIRRLGFEIRAALSSQPDLRLVIGHGSGSFGHQVAHQFQTQAGDIHADSWRGFVETARAAAQLNRIVVDILFAAGVPVVSLQPLASASCQSGEIVSYNTYPLSRVLAAGLVPVVYGDVALDDTKGFTIISTEQIFAHIAETLLPDRIVLAGIVDGVFGADPLIVPDADIYPLVTAQTWPRIRNFLGGSHATDVTGGMASKVQGMLQLVEKLPSLEVLITSGEIPGRVESGLTGRNMDGGTTIRAVSGAAPEK